MQDQHQEPDLQVLALLFTCVKLLFLQGRLSTCKALCDPVTEALSRMKIELHLTCIRNEAAFIHLISGLLQHSHRRVQSPEESLLQPLFICGDSHCLSGMPGPYCPAFSLKRLAVHPWIVLTCPRRLWKHMQMSCKKLGQQASVVALP